MSDIHFVLEADYDVAIRYRSGIVMLDETQYLSLDDYKLLVAYVKKQTTFEPFKPRPLASKLGLSQSGMLVMNDGNGHLLKCRVSLLPTKKHDSLVLRIIKEKEEKANDFPKTPPLMK